jgi:hypothetical protein
MAVPADGRCVRVVGTGGEGAAAGVPVVLVTGGVLVWLLAACPLAAAGAEDLHTAGQVPGLRGDSCAASQSALLDDLAAACPEMTSLAGLIGAFAALLAPQPRNAGLLQRWTAEPRAADLPYSARLRQRPGPGRRGRHPALPQRPHGRSEHQDQDDQAADVRPWQLHPPTPPDAARLTARSVITRKVRDRPLSEARPSPKWVEGPFWRRSGRWDRRAAELSAVGARRGMWCR